MIKVFKGLRVRKSWYRNTRVYVCVRVCVCICTTGENVWKTAGLNERIVTILTSRLRDKYVGRLADNISEIKINRRNRLYFREQHK